MAEMPPLFDFLIDSLLIFRLCIAFPVNVLSSLLNFISKLLA
jgi:hypothetical protein